MLSYFPVFRQELRCSCSARGVAEAARTGGEAVAALLRLSTEQRERYLPPACRPARPREGRFEPVLWGAVEVRVFALARRAHCSGSGMLVMLVSFLTITSFPFFKRRWSTEARGGPGCCYQIVRTATGWRHVPRCLEAEHLLAFAELHPPVATKIYDPSI